MPTASKVPADETPKALKATNLDYISEENTRFMASQARNSRRPDKPPIPRAANG